MDEFVHMINFRDFIRRIIQVYKLDIPEELMPLVHYLPQLEHEIELKAVE